jgi:hypothetical protein
VAWVSLVEHQIREAMDAGAFDDLPHHVEAPTYRQYRRPLDLDV